MSNEKMKPILKWAGGKGQMLSMLEPYMPKHFNKYIEPFFGGGALFFDTLPKKAIIADSNEELINLYRVVSNDVDSLIKSLKKYKYDKDLYYETRALDPSKLTSVEAAARTIYLNRTGFNGLYRVNRKGEFNVPFGKYKNPTILNEPALRNASKALQSAKIINGDYLDVLRKYAQPGDFIFLDPPYLPISEYADFKRYTKDQFYLEDQERLAEEVKRLHELGCYVMLTNSNHPKIRELYAPFEQHVFQTRRSISSKSNTRKGEDLMVLAYPNNEEELIPIEIPKQNKNFPNTRYMGSKEKLLPYINAAVKDLGYSSVIDLFSGSGVVSYFFKTLGKKVISNDYMRFASSFSAAMVMNNNIKITQMDLDLLFDNSPSKHDHFVADTFKGLYFSDEDNDFLDLVRSNLHKLTNQTKKDIVIAALARACMKRRPRGIFTYTGNRYNDGRKDLQLSLKEHFIKAVAEINMAVFDNGKDNLSENKDFRQVMDDADLIYLDPPYYSKLSDNEYVRRYHFVEGLAKDWKNVEMQWNTKTKKFKNYPTPFKSRESTYQAFNDIFSKYRNKKVVVSYSSNSLPTKNEMVEMMNKYFNCVKVYKIDYRYSFGTHSNKSGNKNNIVKEYLFVGY